jgi:cytochrome bd ubiquinol oxidase subunit I
VLLGSLLQGAFFVMSISAWYVLRGRHEDLARRSFDVALAVALVGSLALLVSGHHQARTVSVTQPTKLAAFEGHFRSGEGGTPLYLFGVPDAEQQRVAFGVGIPKLLSVLVHDDPAHPVTALDRFPSGDWPPLGITFQSYHLMVALGMGFIGLTVIALIHRWRGSLYRTRWLLWGFVGAVVGPIVANQSGWVAAEVGRQPWVVYGLLRTRDAVSPVVPASHVLASIILFSLIYLGLFALWVFVLHHKITSGPDSTSGVATPGGLLGTAARHHPGGESLSAED